MGTFLRAIADGVLEGGVYGLMAVGLTLIFGVLDIINIAQGIMVVLGAYLTYVLFTHLHIDQFVGLLITVPTMFILGVGIQYLFIRPLRGRERTSMSLLACYAVAIIIEGILYQIFGSNYVSYNTYWDSPQAEVKIGGYYIPYILLAGFALAVLLVVAVYWMLYRTQFGRSVRATMQDHTAARLVGIDVNRVAALTFGIGVAVTAVGGMVFGTNNAFNPNTGYDLISRLLAIVILGGLGSIGGALGAAVLVITLASLVDVYWNPEWSTVVFYGAMVLVLVFRPQGLFGRKEARAQ
jgi:branched-chain amino acid transport system permease protein